MKKRAKERDIKELKPPSEAEPQIRLSPHLMLHLAQTHNKVVLSEAALRRCGAEEDEEEPAASAALHLS